MLQCQGWPIQILAIKIKLFFVENKWHSLAARQTDWRTDTTNNSNNSLHLMHSMQPKNVTRGQSCLAKTALNDHCTHRRPSWAVWQTDRQTDGQTGRQTLHTSLTIVCTQCIWCILIKKHLAMIFNCFKMFTWFFIYRFYYCQHLPRDDIVGT